MAKRKRAASPKETAGGKSKKTRSTTKEPTTAASRTGSLSPAQSAVFNTTELFENILIQLPWKQLFPVQRVCRKFRNVISGSVRLQQRVFLRSCVPVESWTLRSKRPMTATLAATLALPHHEFEFVPSTNTTTNAIEKLKPVELCPLATVVDGQISAAHRLALGSEACEIQLVDLYSRPGSWRNILLTDPPCQEITVDTSIEFLLQDECFEIETQDAQWNGRREYCGGGGENVGGRKKKRVTADESTESRRITRGLATNMARNAVLDTTELLEAILVCLPFKDLFVIQRVSRRFHDVIAGSTQLQEKMWLRPYSSSFKRESLTLRTRNPIPQGETFELPPNYDERELLPASKGLTNVIRQHIVLADITPLAEPAYFRTLRERLFLADSEIRLDFSRLHRMTGSWRKLLITDPPCEEVDMDASIQLEDPHSSDGSRWYERLACLQNENGMNLGDLWDAVFLPTKSSASQPTLKGVTRSPAEGADGIPKSSSEHARITTLIFDVLAKDVFIATKEERLEVMRKGKT